MMGIEMQSSAGMSDEKSERLFCLRCDGQCCWRRQFDASVAGVMEDCWKPTWLRCHRCCPCRNPSKRSHRGGEDRRCRWSLPLRSRETSHRSSCRWCRTASTISIQLRPIRVEWCDLRSKIFVSSHCTRQSADLAVQTKSCPAGDRRPVERLERPVSRLENSSDP